MYHDITVVHDRILESLYSENILQYLLLWSDVALVDEGFDTYIVRGEGLFSKVDLEELVTHFVVKCNDEASIAAAKSMTYEEVLSTAINFFKWFEG